MTQAFNLSQFANKLNSSGQTDNTGLQNSAVSVVAGTGMSGGGSVALGSSVTLINAGVTSIVAGTNISVSGATGAVTVSAISALPGILAQRFTSSGTFTIPTGVTAIKATVVGAGGGAGGIDRSALGSSAGGGGATAISWLTGLTSGATLTVTVGAAGTGGTPYNGTAGGTSSLASGTQAITTISSTGGSGGYGTQAGGPEANPVAGGTATGGQINIPGGQGEGANGTTNAKGGNSAFAGYLQRIVSYIGAGNAGYSFGVGGDGCITTATYNGGNGGGGIVIIEW